MTVHRAGRRRTSTPTGPLGGWLTGTDPWTDLVVLAALTAAVAVPLALIFWAAGALTSLALGHGPGPGPLAAARIVLDGGGLRAVWPAVPAGAVLALTGVLTVAVVAVGARTTRRWRRSRRPREGFGRRDHLASILPGRTALRRAERLRPTLTRPGARVRPGDLGVPLGRYGFGTRGPMLRASWEDVVLAICAPRTGKTTALAVPAILDAPGPVVVTSNKADVWHLTATTRARGSSNGTGSGTGNGRDRVWVFDPQDITGAGQHFAWDALAGITTVTDARRLATHFTQEIRRDADTADFWDRDAEDLLTALILAAALAGTTLATVGHWLTHPTAVGPRTVLTDHGFTHLADTLTGRSHGAVETREGVYATARAAAAALADPAIMTWVTPRPGLDLFDPAAFVRSHHSLYLLSKDGAGSAAPLVAAFTDRLLLEAVRAAEQTPGGRLDPPLVAVLDEAANICRITELPRLYSHLGSRGIVPITILQSRSQGRRVWGTAGMDELFSAATIKLIGAGIDDPAFADDISRLLGDHDIRVLTHTHAHHRGSSSISVTTRPERVLAADQVRALPPFTALLLATGTRPAPLRLVPWMDGPHADAIRAAHHRGGQGAARRGARGDQAERDLAGSARAVEDRTGQGAA